MHDFDIGYRTGVRTTILGALLVGIVVFLIMGMTTPALAVGVALLGFIAWANRPG